MQLVRRSRLSLGVIMGREWKNAGYERAQVIQLCAQSGLVLTRQELQAIFDVSA